MMAEQDAEVRVDFYVLPNHTANGRLELVCKLTEKAYGLGHKVYIHAASPGQAQQLDDLLWTFKQNSFVPHALYPPGSEETAPVLIGAEQEPDGPAEVLINLAAEAPPFYRRCARVVEVVDQDPQVLQGSRARFKAYREQGLEPRTHKL